MEENRSIFLNSNDGTSILALGKHSEIKWDPNLTLNDLDEFLKLNSQSYIFGYLSYDAKNLLFSEFNSNVYNTKLPYFHFWVPELVATIKSDAIDIVSGFDYPNAEMMVSKVLETFKQPLANNLPDFHAITSKRKYIENVLKIKELIQRGDIYEVNYCQEFALNDFELNNMASLYSYVNDKTQAPFSSYLQTEDVWVASGSPERFIKKKGNKIISQPIKGTAARGNDVLADARLKENLRNDEKEQSENVMIVDLVRNDLSKIALPSSVQVDELFEIYSYRTVHQLISTISCEIRPDIHFSEIIKALFPMGSMTGAPKLNALKYIDSFEDFSRGIYSGSIGYFDPNGDFDFNVVIRSLIYHPKDKTLNCPVGGAITAASEPEKEYDECMVKIGKIISISDEEIH